MDVSLIWIDLDLMGLNSCWTWTPLGLASVDVDLIFISLDLTGLEAGFIRIPLRFTGLDNRLRLISLGFNASGSSVLLWCLLLTSFRWRFCK